jgi:tetratricopeptide (TPR) repeat protein
MIFAVMLASAPAHADGTDDARGHFARAVVLYRESDFRGALIEFQRAYDAAPNYKVLYNVGQTAFELEDYPGALKAFRRYLDDGGDEISAERRSSVEADLRTAEGHVTPVIDVAEDKPPVLSLTPPIVVVQRAATERLATNPIVAGNTTTKGLADPVYFGVMVYTTGALVVGWAALGAAAFASNEDYRTKASQVGVPSSQVESALNQSRTLALASDIVGGVAIGAVITTIILALVAPSKHVGREHAHLVVGPFALGIRGEL